MFLFSLRSSIDAGVLWTRAMKSTSIEIEREQITLYAIDIFSLLRVSLNIFESLFLLSTDDDFHSQLVTIIAFFLNSIDVLFLRESSSTKKRRRIVNGPRLLNFMAKTSLGSRLNCFHPSHFFCHVQLAKPLRIIHKLKTKFSIHWSSLVILVKKN